MNTSNKSSITSNHSPITQKDQVILLDGRIIEIEMGKRERIADRDGNSKPMRLDILEPGNL
ncbi:hypothetical protein OA77_23680, partial [Pseudomonas coronafaciens]